MKRFLYYLFAFFYLFVQVQMACAIDSHARSDDANALITKIIAAYGGKSAVERTTGISAVGTINAFMRQDSGTYKLLFKRPRKLRVETKYQRSFEKRILIGNTGYRESDATPSVQVKDQRFLTMVYQYKHFDILYGFLNGYYSVSREGKENLHGNMVEVLHLTDQEGPPMDVYVDDKTFFIVKVTGYFVMPDGRKTSLSSEFSDFRNVADTVFPFKVANYAGGQKIAETIMQSYIINPEISDSAFVP
jgi:outer membrane lipoprotein-sorting protein